MRHKTQLELVQSAPNRKKRFAKIKKRGSVLAAVSFMCSLVFLALISRPGTALPSGFVSLSASKCFAVDTWYGYENAEGQPSSGSLSGSNSAVYNGGLGAMDCRGFAVKSGRKHNLAVTLKVGVVGPSTSSNISSLSLDGTDHNIASYASRGQLLKPNASSPQTDSQIFQVSVSFDNGNHETTYYRFSASELPKPGQSGLVSVALPVDANLDLSRLAVRLEGLQGGAPTESILVDSVDVTYTQGINKQLTSHVTNQLGDSVSNGVKYASGDGKSIHFQVSAKDPEKSTLSNLATSISQTVSSNPQTNESVQSQLTGPDGYKVDTEFKSAYRGQDAGGQNTWDISAIPAKQMKIGKYTATFDVVDAEGNTQTIKQDFTWGVLAINPDKTVYRPGDTANFAFGVLDDKGNMVCDAQLTLDIQGPYTSARLSTKDGSIHVNDVCQKEEHTTQPDFQGAWQIKKGASQAGLYKLTLTAVTPRGTYVINDHFEVRANPAVDVSRSGPTRIYPYGGYDMSAKITPAQDFNGTITEPVPASFVIKKAKIIDSSNGKIVASAPDILTRNEKDPNAARNIVWNASLKGGHTYALSYEFDAPDFSPEFWLLGAMKFDAGSKTVFQETRQWQIASDATNKFMAFWSSGTLPSGWVCVSCTTGDDFYQLFPRGNTTAGGTGGSSTHTHTTSLVTNGSSSATVSGKKNGSAGNAEPHTHGWSGTATASDTSMPVYRDLQVIRYDTVGNPPNIPNGVILMFDATPSGSGWTRYSSQDANFIYGMSDSTGTGGAATHQHGNAAGTLTASSNTSNANTGSGANIASATHTHSLTFNTAAGLDHTPPYIDVLLYQNTSGSSKPLPIGAIMMSNGATDTDWTTLSGSGGAFNTNFIRGNSTYGGTGGATSHTPANQTFTSGAVSGTATDATSNPTSTYPSSTHTHSVTLSYGAANNLPPYRDTIFAKYNPPQTTPKIVQDGYTLENDGGTSSDNSTVQAGSNFSVSGDRTLSNVKKGERITIRMQIRNNGSKDLTSNLGLFYDHNDGYFTKVKSSAVNSYGTGNCTDTNFDCTTVDNLNSNSGDYTSMAVSPAGVKYVAYISSNAPNNILTVSRYVGSGGNCTDTAWQCEQIDTNGSIDWTSIAFSPSGTPYIAYGSGGGGAQTLKVASYVGSGGSCTSTAWSCTTVDSIAVDTGHSASIAFTASGTPYISYEDATNTSLKVAWYVGTGGTCTSTAWSCTTVDNTGTATGGYTSLAIDPSGNPWVSYYDFTNTSLKVAWYVGGSSGTCTDTAWSCTTVDNTGTSTGQYTSIAFDPSGNPWVSYYDATNTALLVATQGGSFGSACTDITWTCGTVDNTGTDKGSYTNIAFDPSGVPWVAYYDATGTALMLARMVSGSGCTSGSWTCTTVDNTGTDTGQMPYVAFGPSGTGYISYYDVTNTALKVATLKRGGEITMSPALATTSGSSTSASHADMTSATDSTNKSDADCINSSSTWQNGKWWSTEEGSGISLQSTINSGNSNGTCTEVSFTIDTSQAAASSTYRFIIVSKDSFDSSHDVWRGPAAVTSGAYPTLTVEADSTSLVRYSKDKQPQFSACTSSSWGCETLDDHASDDLTGQAQLAVAPDGTAWVAYQNLTTTSIKVAKYVGGSSGTCATAPETGSNKWDCTVVVSDSSQTFGGAVGISFAPDGIPWIAFYRSGTCSSSNSCSLMVGKYVGSGGSGCGSSGSSAWTCTVVDDHATDDIGTGGDTLIAFDSNGNPWVTYRDITTASLKVAHYVGGTSGTCATSPETGSSAWNCTTVADDATNDLGSFASIAFSPNGIPYISFMDVTNFALYVAQYVGSGGSGCGSAGSAAWLCTKVDDHASDTIGYTGSLAFDSSGTPWVTYEDRSAFQLKVAKYVGGSSGTCATAPETGSSAWDCSVVQSGGSTYNFLNPRIAFDSAGNASISVDQCSGAICVGTAKMVFLQYVGGSGGTCSNTAWNCTDVDNTGNVVGSFASVAYDNTGAPWVSYMDITNHSMKVAKMNLPSTPPSSSYNSAFRSRNAGMGDAAYHLDRGKAPYSESGTCSATTDYKGYCGVSANDSDYDTMAAGANQRPLYVFANDNSANTSVPTPSWIGQSNVAASSKNIVLQVYQYGTTNSWTTITTNSTCSASTDCTVTGTPSGTASDFYKTVGSKYRAYFRVYQAENTSSESLKTNAFSVNFTGSNSAPNSPSSLVQKKTTGGATLNVGDWTNEASVTFTASATDPDTSDTLYLCIEKKPINTAFTNTEDSCGTGVAYSGSAVTVTDVIGSQTDATEYHWQARLKDAAGAYSSWVSYGGNSDTITAARDYGIDTTAPTGGTVYDGTSVGVDTNFNNGTLTTLSANWSGFTATVSGLASYDYSIGTTACGTGVKGWTTNGTSTSVTDSSLTLQTSQIYYFNVRAIDNAGNTGSCVSSDGQFVTPSLSFSISPSSITFNNLNTGNSYTDTQNTTLTTSTNAFAGYAVKARALQLLTAGSNTIPMFNGGTYALPDSWQSGDTGFGYTSSDTLVSGTNKFQSSTCPGGSSLSAPGCYAPFSLTAPGDIVVDATTNVSADAKTIYYRVTTSNAQAAGAYTTTIVYSISASY